MATQADCPAKVTLSGYQLIATYSLPSATLSGASAVAWNWDSDTLLIVPDSGLVMVMVSKTGTVLSQMTMKNFADTEGLTYMGGGTYALSEERLGRAYKFTYVAGGTLDRNTLQSIAIGPNTGTNDGSEGVSFDPRDGSWVSIKEKNPQNVYRVTGSFATGCINLHRYFRHGAVGRERHRRCVGACDRARRGRRTRCRQSAGTKSILATTAEGVAHRPNLGNAEPDKPCHESRRRDHGCKSAVVHLLGLHSAETLCVRAASVGSVHLPQ